MGAGGGKRQWEKRGRSWGWDGGKCGNRGYWARRGFGRARSPGAALPAWGRAPGRANPTDAGVIGSLSSQKGIATESEAEVNPLWLCASVNTGPRKGQKLLIPQFSLNLPFSPSRHSSFSPFVDRRDHVKCQDLNRPSLLFFLNHSSLISWLSHALPKASTGSLRKGNWLLQTLTQFSRMSLTSSPSLSFILSTNIYGAGFVLSAGDTASARQPGPSVLEFTVW